MKGIGVLLVLAVLAGCASKSVYENPGAEARAKEASERCPVGYYKMCEEKQGDEFCTCVKPMYNPPSSGVPH